MPRPWPGAKSKKPRCRATSKRTGERCRSFPVRGATVCRMHGLTKAGRRNAKAVEAMRKVILPDLRRSIEHDQEFLRRLEGR
jgi:hypothetical protein